MTEIIQLLVKNIEVALGIAVLLVLVVFYLHAKKKRERGNPALAEAAAKEEREAKWRAQEAEKARLESGASASGGKAQAKEDPKAAKLRAKEEALAVKAAEKAAKITAKAQAKEMAKEAAREASRQKEIQRALKKGLPPPREPEPDAALASFGQDFPQREALTPRVAAPPPNPLAPPTLPPPPPTPISPPTSMDASPSLPTILPPEAPTRAEPAPPALPLVANPIPEAGPTALKPGPGFKAVALKAVNYGEGEEDPGVSPRGPKARESAPAAMAQDSPGLSPTGARPGAKAAGARPGGAVFAGQTQMATPIKIDQTQLPQNPRAAAPTLKKSVTIQDLAVAYEKRTFMTPLEITYYKLLRGALKQYLIFPRVSAQAVVKATGQEPEHQKIADNVLSGTSLSFIVCDVRLNIRAVVEVVDESQVPSNKDKARDYILKKAGCLIVRFYSGDKPPDVETLRLQIVGSM
ncbi:MAG: DUF2726 domain-containing protein [Deltaproteobacteria bacterium]|jgi:hypothetical protein|nr:DUF2726 domain-containing protein [Deltaproteobacteria bacterium]